MTTYYIYGLIDPTTKEVHYVGYSQYPKARLHQHLSYGRHNNLKMCTGKWIAGLLALGLRPELKILEEYVTDWPPDAHEVEKQWIVHYVNQGSPLLNRHKAGDIRRYSKILPGKERRLRLDESLGWYYTDD